MNRGEARLKEPKLRDCKALFLDIDGTIVGASGEMSAKVKATLEKTIHSGRIIVLATGRSLAHTRTLVEDPAIGGYGILLNGGMIVDWDTGEIVRSCLIDLIEAQNAVRICHEHDLAPVWFGMNEEVDSVWTDRKRMHWRKYESDNAYRMIYLEDLTCSLQIEPASLAAFGTEREIKSLADAWATAFADAMNVTAAPTDFYRGWYAQMTTIKADKATAVEWVAAKLGIDRESTFAIGDQVNDLRMLKWAGLGVCMGDGSNTVKLAANYVTGTLAEDGAATAIERFVLI